MAFKPLLCTFGLFIGLTLAFTEAQSRSPAWNMLETALDHLEAYYGYQTFSLPELRERFGSRLQSLCLDHPECGFPLGTRVVDELAAAVNDGHTFRLNPTQRRASEADFQNANLPNLGLRFAALPDAPALVVTRVLETTPAWQAGIRRGDVVWAVGGQPLERFESAQEAINAIQSRELDGQTVTLTVSRGSAARRSLRLEPRMRGPWLPSLEVRFDGVSIITVYQFRSSGQVANRVHELIRQALAANARAIIVDVRHSAGGSAFEAMGVAGAFLQPVGLQMEGRVGGYALEYRDGTVQYVGRVAESRVVNQPASWDGPLVILTNRSARSAAEYMTHFVQRSARAWVIGEATAGVLNTSTTLLSLPDGSQFAVTSGRSFNPNATPHPVKITPDQVVPDDLGALSRGRDVILEAALKFLKE
jgi:carboxyl-terminal processing protease